MITMIKDPAGKLSSSRILYTIVVLMVMAVWAWLSVAEGVMIAIDPGVVGVVLVLAGNKTATSFAEGRK